VQALASELDYGICILSLGEMGLSDDHLQRLLADAPERTLILLEDIDAGFPSASAEDPTRRTRGDLSTYNTLTFSGLLNALDGVAAAEGRIIFMTTNHLAKLDAALIRPGRIDRIEYLGLADRNMLSALWTRFYGPEASSELHQSLASLPHAIQVEDRLSMAQAQGLCLSHKNNAIAATHALVTLLNGGKSHDSE
jgi:chaperone BCS1